jgi:predicted ATPase/DNA-binding SARP family transcriptional activator
MMYRVLGPVEVMHDDGTVPLGGDIRRALLAVLLLERGHVVSASTLIEVVWGERPPRNPAAGLHTHLSHLRRALGADGAALVSRAGGYCFDVDRGLIDLFCFRDEASRGREMWRSGKVDDAATTLADALALWRGPALGGLENFDFARGRAATLDDERLAVIEDLADVEMELDHAATVVPLLDETLTDHPLRERAVGQLMVALYRCGRQADALAACERARVALRDDLGLSLSPHLRDLEAAVLQQSPSLLRPGVGVATHGHDLRDAADPGPDVGGSEIRVPQRTTSFVGRENELADLQKALEIHRVVTLTGGGGSGKTSLAVEAAHAVGDRFAQGARFVDLSPVTDGAHVPGAVASALGLQEHLAATVTSVCEGISDADVLLLLDNCEQVIDDCATLVGALLRRCPHVRILATSRESLHTAGECVVVLSSLTLPAPQDDSVDVDSAWSSGAVRLFVDRAQAVFPNFELSPATLGPLAVVCRRLDGIPLAIELAAPLVASLPIAEIARRLEDRLAVLKLAHRGELPRHQTLKSALDWSYDLLSGGEQDALLALSTFVGLFTLPAATHVIDGDDGEATSTVSELVRKSLVVVQPDEGGNLRYRLLEIPRAYALERLRERGLEADARRRHAAHYVVLVEDADSRLHGPDSADSADSLDLIERELPNLREALAWSFNAPDHEYALRLAGALHPFFGRMGNLDELCLWLDPVLERRDELTPRLRLMALVARATLSFDIGDYSRTAAYGEEAVTLARELDDRRLLMTSLIVRGQVAVYEGNTGRARECFDEAMPVTRELGERWARGWLLTGSGTARRREGDLAAATADFEESLAIFRELRNSHGQVLPLVNLAMLAQQSFRPADAISRGREAIETAARLRDRQLQHVAVTTLGRIALDQGHQADAKELLLEALVGFRGAEHRLMVAIAIEGIAIVATQAGQPVDAAVLIGFADALRERSNMPLGADRRRERAATLGAIESDIGSAATERAGQVGATLTQEVAVSRAAAICRAPVPVMAPAARPPGPA